ncbi:MAG: response regulator [Lachnospiraceae bacterium]|nr:response regulator [Lachnospiraceae bacterium]
METIYKLFELFGMFISFVCCVEFLRVKSSDNQRNLMLTSLCGFIACVGNALEVYSTSPDEAMVAIKVAYIGKCYIMTFGLMFVSGYSSVKLPKNLIKFLGITNTIILASIMTCERTRLYYKTIECEIRPNGRAAMILGKGPFYYIWIGLLMLTALLYVFIAWREIKRGSRIAKMRMSLIFLAVASPTVAAVVFLILQPKYFDPATLAIVMTEVCFLIAAERYGLLYTLELARERILEDTKDGVIVVDNTKSVILYANPAADHFVKKVFEQDGELNFDLFHGANEFVYEFEEKHYEIRISEIRQKIGSRDIQGYIVWIFDMTFIDQYTNEMIRLREESEKANQAKTNFLAHMSHEIRTPMNSIVGYAEMALRSGDETLVHGYIRNIKESSRTLLHLINEILDISKIETGKMENVKVNYRFRKLIGEIRSMMEAQAGNAGLAFLMEIDDAIPEYLYGDRVKIQEIVTNLINNGLKYTRKGSVTLRVLQKETEEKRVLLRIEVEDTGIGIKEEDYGKVFSKFERLDRQENYLVEGSGLGLSIVKGFVDMLGGTITYESTYGKGTKFIVSIWQEIGYDDKSTEIEENAAGEDIPINSGRILIVDDNELNCDVASGIMELLGMRTQTVMSGFECLELLEKGERFDMIFMDHMMPEMDGLETMKKIRVMDDDISQIPIVLLTANAVTGVREEMLREGFDDFLSKPIDVDELRRILIRFLGVK